MDSVVIEENFLSKEETSYLLDVAKKNKNWYAQEHVFWKDRVIHIWDLEIKKTCPESLRFFMDKIISKTSNVIYKNFSIEKVYVDTIDLVRWPTGKFQSPHIDEIPHRHRKWGSVIYLNNDFDGGEIYYPNIDLVIKPKPGMMVLHRGDEIHRHGVTEIAGETRYAISSFWGVEQDKSLWYNNKSIL